MNRNYEKELMFYQQELAKALSDKIIIQSILDDTLEELERIKNDEKNIME